MTVMLPAGAQVRATLPDVLRAAAELYGDREFIVRGQDRLTYTQADDRSAALARGLLALGVSKASRIGLLLPNCPDWAVCWFAASRTGGSTVALSTFYRPPELSWALAHNDIDTLIVAPDFLDADYVSRLETAIPGLRQSASTGLFLSSHPYLRRVIVWGPCDRAWALKGEDALIKAGAVIDDALLAAAENACVPSDPLITICTSGSTAEPKAVVHSHGGAMRAIEEFLPFYDWRSDDRAYSGHPFFWIGGLNVNLLPVLFTGGCVVCSPSPKPDILAEVLARERVTRVSMWPAQARGVLDEAARKGLDLSHIRMGLFEPRDRIGAVIAAEHRVGGVFGMTESFGMHSIWPLNRPAPPEKAGTMGRALRGIKRRIVDPVSREILPRGATGELEIRGATMMLGYYKRARAVTFTEDGFFATGDLCSEDTDGFLTFHGRAHEMIKTTGANVSPREVELVIAKCHGVREAIVMGLPDPERGEIVSAVVVPDESADIRLDDIRARVAQELSSYKRPRQILVRPHHDIPRTDSGKVDKNRLRPLVQFWLGDSLEAQ
jgi:acyl-CoA synthetase (AMP-forming)/AMP-acid ligase II